MEKKRLSTYQYFETLQVEYICAKLRAKIYRSRKDKTYWNKVAEGKKITIEQIADRNKLPTIFTDLDLQETLNRRVYKEDTYPNFVYRNETHKLAQENLDLQYYFYRGSEVRVDLNGEVAVGVIKKFSPYRTVILIIVKGEEVEYQISNVVRIL